MTETVQHPAFDDLQNAFEHFANRTALIDKEERSYTYAEFQQYISGAYWSLQAKGVNKGAKVLVAVPMSLELYAVLEAIFAIGATAIFLDPWMKGKKMSSVINQVQPDLFIVTKKLSRITWLLPATWKLKKWKLSEIKKSSESYPIAAVDDEDNALITFTSGTSGKPKGANRTFAFLHAQAETLKAHLDSSGKASVDYTNFPIVGLANFALGNTVVIPQLNLMKIHKSSSTQIIQQITNQKVNRLIVSPSLLKKAIATQVEINTLETVMTGGAPISISLVKTALKKYPDVHFEAIYGSTEAEPICITTFLEINEKLKEPLKGVYVGKPVTEVQLKIIQVKFDSLNDFEQGSINATTFVERELTNGEVGEIVVTGEHVNKNYFENPEAFKRNKIVDNSGVIWHRTGDLGYLENDVLYIVGRDHRLMHGTDRDYHPYPLEQFVELEFGISDVGYVQNIATEFCLYYYSEITVNETELKAAIKRCDYPIDKIIKMNKPLPRDARHKSKLQIETLVI